MGATVRVLGGGNNSRFFSLTDGTTPSVSTTVAFSIVGEIISASVNKQDTGQYDVVIEHVYDTSTLQTYLETYINVTTSSAIEELLFEDGIKEAAATSSNQKQLAVIGGGYQGGDTAAAKKAYVGGQRLKSNSGAYVQTAETYNRVTLEYEGFKLGGELVVAATFLNSIAKTPTTVVTLTTSLPYGTIVYR